MITSLLEVLMVIEFHPNGMVGSTTNMMINHFPIVIHSMIHSLKNHINGINPLLPSDYMFLKLPSLILNFYNTDKPDKINMLLNGLQSLEEHDLNIYMISINSIFYILNIFPQPNLIKEFILI